MGPPYGKLPILLNGMGPAYHKGVPLLGVPGKSPLTISRVISSITQPIEITIVSGPALGSDITGNGKDKEQTGQVSSSSQVT